MNNQEAGCNVAQIKKKGNEIDIDGFQAVMNEMMSTITVRVGFVAFDKDENGKERAYYCVDGKKYPIDVADARRSRNNQKRLGNVVEVQNISEGISQLLGEKEEW